MYDCEDRGVQASIVITKSIKEKKPKKYLILRTLDTPDRSVDSVNKIVKLWEKKALEKSNSEQLRFKGHMRQFGEANDGQYNQLICDVQMKLLQQYCRQNSLVLFLAENGNEFNKVEL